MPLLPALWDTRLVSGLPALLWDSWPFHGPIDRSIRHPADLSASGPLHGPLGQFMGHPAVL